VPAPEVAPVFEAAAASASKELATQSVRRVMQASARARLSARAYWKLAKDYRASLLAKAAFYRGRAPAGELLAAYARTARNGTALFYAADCAVSVVLVSARAAALPLPRRRRARVAAISVAGQLARCGLSYLVAPLLAAAAAYLRPSGVSITVGQIVGEALVGVAVLLPVQRAIDAQLG
jgi:hypothetical protein